MSLPEVGEIASKDHTTVMYYIKCFHDRINNEVGITPEEADSLKKALVDIRNIFSNYDRITAQTKKEYMNRIHSILSRDIDKTIGDFIKFGSKQGFNTKILSDFLGYPLDIVQKYKKNNKIEEGEFIKSCVSIPNYKNGYIERIIVV